MSKTCKDSFDQGQSDRLERPLPYGAYRLRQCLDRLYSFSDELERIAAIKRKALNQESLRHCTAEDMATWLRHLPASLAYDLAYDILPGIKALKADGLPVERVNQLYGRAARFAPDIVNALELARISLQPIQDEYDRMKRGDSCIWEPLQHEIAMLESALRLADSTHEVQ